MIEYIDFMPFLGYIDVFYVYINKLATSKTKIRESINFFDNSILFDFL